MSTVQLDKTTQLALTHFAHRRKVLLVLRTIAVGVIFFVASMVVVAVCDYLWLMSDSVRWLLSLAAYAVIGFAMWWFGIRHFGNDDPREVARRLESADPRLREDLLSAVELADPADANGSESFREWLQHRVGHSIAGLNIGNLLPVGLIQRWLMMSSLIAIVFLTLMFVPKMQFGRRIARAMLPVMPIERASLTKVNIIKPAPPSGYVAEGDAVGVSVEISGREVADVVMQWRTADGVEGEALMTPRVASDAAPSSSAGTLLTSNLYAANLSVATTPVEYRIIAGDAITLWHKLTPLPRPRVELFQKRFIFPDYAQLEDRVEEAEHGDLKALVGTMATLTVRFDQPVEGAMMLFGNRGVTREMEAVEGSDREFTVNVPIKTPANYQVDATSTDSGLNNPFSPQYTITPIIDAPPSVRWDPSLSKTQIVSPLDVLKLAGIAVDDLPLDQITQEFQVNAEPVLRRNIPVAEPGRELKVAWDWDLMERTADKPSIKLNGGDIIWTRIVALDRQGRQGESEFIELLVAEDGFDRDRHQRLDTLQTLAVAVADWSKRAKLLMEPLHKTTEQFAVEPFNQAHVASKDLLAERPKLIEQLVAAISNSQSLPEAGSFELVARAVLNLEQEMTRWFSETDEVFQESHEAWKPNRERKLRELANQSRQLHQEAARIEQYAQAIFGQEMTVGIMADAMSLQRSLRPLLKTTDPLPAERFPRYLTVVNGRMAAIDEMIARYSNALPESTVQHLNGWHQWVDNWTARLNDAIKQPPNPDALRGLVSQFEAELDNQVRHAMIDGRLPSTLTGMLNEIRIQVGPTSDHVRAIAQLGEQAEQARKRGENENDSNRVAEIARDEKFATAGFNAVRQLLLDRLVTEESIHQSRPTVDLQYAADMTLMHRAIENVTKAGYAPYREEPAPVVFQQLALAFQVIEAKHEADGWLAELQSLLTAERKLEETSVAKIKHAEWLERFSTGLEWSVRTLQNAGIDWSLLAKIDDTRYNADFNQARERITSRRWSGPEMLTGETPLDTMQSQLATALLELDPKVLEARATIAKYVLSLPEQAREAAEKAEEAQERTDKRPDDQAETAEQLQEQQQEAEQAADETMESLVDVANTADITSPEERELARDADAAAAQIQDAKERAEAAMQDANKAADEQARQEALEKSEQALEDLAAALRETAEHFEKLEQGEDVSQSREELRKAEQELNIQNQLQERQDRSEAMAQAAQKSPAEMLKQLEEELQKNQPMQAELSEIAERAAEAAQRTLEQAAQQEQSLNNQLERSDESFQEQKRRMALQIQQLSQRAATIDQSMMNAAERAVGWANTPEAQPKLQQAREQLREAVQQANQMGGDNALLPKMNQTAKEMSEAIQKASEAMEEVKKQAEAALDKNIHNDDRSRDQAKQQLERFEREARTQKSNGANTEKQRWDAYEREAERRAQQAKNQMKNVEKTKDQTEQQLKKAETPDARKSLEAQQAQLQQRIADFQRAEQAANQTSELAKNMKKQAEDRKRAADEQKLESLDKPNPAAELAKRSSEQARADLQQIKQELDAVANQTEFGQDLRTPQEQSEQLARQQQRVEQDVNDAAEQLRRAARHEERLGQESLAQQLDAAADAVASEAAKAAQEAAQALQQAAQDAQQAPQANQKVAEAGNKISEAAQQLAELLAGMEQQTGESAEAAGEQGEPAEQPGQPQSAQAKAEQMAQTLDELDRSLAQQQSQQQGQEPGQQQGQQPGQQQASQQGEPSQQGQPGQQPSQPTAAEASQTLANALDAQTQRSARQRQQQMNPSQGQGQKPSDQQAQNSATPGQESGLPGEMPDGGMVDIDGIERTDGEWGLLRERKTEDAAQSRSATIAPQFRREIEAYFRAIAKRSAEKTE